MSFYVDHFSGGRSATQNIVFSNTGMVVGTVSHTNGTVASTGTVQIDGLIGGFPVPPAVPIGIDGSYRITGLPPGLRTFQAIVPALNGTPLQFAFSVNVLQGQTIVRNVVLPPVGTITGTVRRSSGVPVVNISVWLRGATNLSRFAVTDTSGHFVFLDVPSGAVTLEVAEPATNTAAHAEVFLQPEQSLVQDLTLQVGAAAAGIVTNLASGQPVAGVQVTATTVNGVLNAVTGSDGRYRIDGIALGAFSLVAFDPVSQLRGGGRGIVGISGQTITINMQLTATGVVSGTVYRLDGTTPAANVNVTIPVTLRNSPATTVTDANGHYSFDLVPVGFFNISAVDPVSGEHGSGNGQISTNAQNEVVDVTLIGEGTVIVQLTYASGNPVGSDRLVTLRIPNDSPAEFTDANGRATFTHVPTGPFTAEATHPANANLVSTKSGTLSVSGSTVNVTLALKATATVRVTALRGDGTPFAGARLTTGTACSSALISDSPTPMANSAFRTSSKETSLFS